MKKVNLLIAIILVLLLILTAAGCSKGENPAGKTDESSGQIAGQDDSQDNENQEADAQDDSLANSMPQLHKDFQNCIIDLEETVSGQNYTTKMYRLNSKGKTDLIVDGTVKESRYSDFAKGEGYYYIADDKSARRDSLIGGAVEYYIADLGEVRTQEMIKSGNENVNGFDCTVYKQDLGNYLVTAWVYEKNKLVVKYELKYASDGKIAKGYTVTQFTTGGVTEEMVTLPPDAQIVQ